MSSGVPMRPRGTADTSRSSTLGRMPAVMAVSTMPGATAPTRIPWGASSRAQVTVLAASAALAAT